MIDLSPGFQIGLALIALFAVGSYVLDGVRRTRVQKRLAKRPRYGDLGYAEHRFAHDPEKLELAARVRKVLEQHLEISLEGLRLDDRLADLEVQLEADPGFFSDLENEFAIHTRIEDYDVYEKLVARLDTVADVVDYVAARVADAGRAKEKKHRWGWNAESCDRVVEAAMPFLCVSGLMLSIPGGVLHVEWMFRVGTFSFVLGLALFFWSFIAGLIWNTASAYLEDGTKPFRENWLTLVVMLLWGGGFLYCGVITVRMLLGIFTEEIPWM